MILDINDIDKDFLLELAILDNDSFAFWFGVQQPYKLVTAVRYDYHRVPCQSLFYYKEQGYVKYRPKGFVLHRVGWPASVIRRNDDELQKGSFYYIPKLTGGEKVIFE